MYIIDWELTWITVSSIAAVISTIHAIVSSRKAKKAKKALDEVLQIQNNIQTTIKNEIAFAMSNTIIAQASAYAIINDDAAMKKIATAVTNSKLNEYTKSGHPPIKTTDRNGREVQTQKFVFTRK